jgi:hypothetical protein
MSPGRSCCSEHTEGFPILSSYALVSKRTRQLMMGGIGNRNTAEVIDYALGELQDGVLAFEMPEKKARKNEPPLARSRSIVTVSEALELEAT